MNPKVKDIKLKNGRRYYIKQGTTLNPKAKVTVYLDPPLCSHKDRIDYEDNVFCRYCKEYLGSSNDLEAWGFDYDLG